MMRFAAAKVLRIILLGIIFVATTGLLHGWAGDNTTSTAEQSISFPLPDLADIIPLAGDLAGSLAQLEYDLQQMLDVAPAEKDYAESKVKVDRIGARLQTVKYSTTGRLSILMDLSQELRDVQALFGDVRNPLGRKINRLAGWKTEWLTEKNKWLAWESDLLMEQDSPPLKVAFSSASEIIDTALKLVSQKLDKTLELQARNKAVMTKIAVLNVEINSLITEERRDYLLTASPPMYSYEYFSQFRGNLWQKVLDNAKTLSLPDRLYVVQHRGAFIAQFLLFFGILFSIYRNRENLSVSERWWFLARRPFATGIFVVILTQLLIPENQYVPMMVRLLSGAIGGIAFVRILMLLVEDSWQRRGILGVITLYVVSQLVNAISLPLPLSRLYIFLASLLAISFLVCWAVGADNQPNSVLYTWGLRLGYLLLGVIVLAQLLGKEGLAAYLFNSTLVTLAIILAFYLFMYMIRGGLRWIFFSSIVWNIKQLRSEAELLTRRSGYLVEALIFWFALFPILLTAWGVYGSPAEATREVLGLGFNIGSEKISVGLLLTVIGILYGAFILSWIMPKVILDEKIAGANLERGVRISIAHLIQYFIVLVGLILALTMFGLDFTKITIILSALGVGIGFGLQGLVNNFISGLVLLFERPVRVGDCIELGEKWVEIKNIGLRATNVQTYDKADVIIPNADLISQAVTNWTLGKHLVRVSIRVGVAYGSDVSMVIDTLIQSGQTHELVSSKPVPEVIFADFGESSLDFELRVWTNDAIDRLRLASDIRKEINERFNEANIEISFPQRDIHIRSADNIKIVTT
ncbi:mechanosensitive ion channel family protein [Desulfopila sp. IMCC35008]|uniref:mechanosensitive ion channel family protein n=1 Tax=Desulfopila sp. IMCC35008 TaxID=2653858 RepID=UPI00197AC7F7|nr:mechanosensitive ion channel domain-containing protein [Desulfopila sp. IMCC35008]